MILRRIDGLLFGRLVGGCALAAVTFAALPAALAQTPKRGGTAIVAIADDLTGINRNISSNNNDGLVACAIYQGLMRIDGKGDVKPFLAKTVNISADGRVYTFDLIKTNWQDGQPFIGRRQIHLVRSQREIQRHLRRLGARHRVD